MNAKMGLKGRFRIEHFDKDGNLKAVYRVPNGIVDVGINKILEDMFNNGTSSATWYIGLVNNSGFTAFANADTMGSHAGWTELTNYTQTTRPEWTAGTATARSITNSSTVDFSINATVSIKGIFIVDNNTKSGTTGTLWSTAAFASVVSAVNGDTLKVTYTVSG
ncbi:MAG: hypothetical protein MN733_12260 [Nitrososphaera sp.]|nr:hypothetical protein [Nitrososphaera sp.]